MKNRSGLVESPAIIVWGMLVFALSLIVFGLLFNAQAKGLKDASHVEDNRVDWEAGYLALSMQYQTVLMDMGAGEQSYRLADLLMEYPLDEMTNDQRRALTAELEHYLHPQGSVWEDDVHVLAPIIVLQQDSASVCADTEHAQLCGADWYRSVPLGSRLDEWFVSSFTENAGTRISTIILPTRPQTAITAIMQPLEDRS